MAESQKSTKFHQCLFIFKELSVEPLLFLFSTHLGMYISVQTTFLYYKQCVQLFSSDYTDDIDYFCKTAIKTNHTAEQQAVETAASHLAGYVQICQTLPAIFISFIAGAWSDQHGRKPPLLVAIAGTTIATFFYTYSAWAITSSNLFVFAAALIGGFTGQLMVVFMIAFSCARDVSTQENLTVRMAIFNSFLQLGIVVGSLIAGAIVDRLGFADVFLLCECFLVLALLYGVFVTRETLKRREQKKSLAVLREDGCPLPNSQQEETALRSVCDQIGINKVFWTLAQPRSAHKRRYLVIGLLALFFSFAAETGSYNILPLFFKYKPLYWTDSTFSYYNSYTIALSAIGTPLGILLFRRVFHLHDTTIVVIAVWCSAAMFAMFAFCRKTWQVAIAGSLSLISHAYFPSYRAFLASLVRSDETGRVFSLVSACENVAPLLATLVFNAVFPLTLNFFPGLVLIFSAAIMIFSSFLVLYIYYSIRMQRHLMDDLDVLLVCD